MAWTYSDWRSLATPALQLERLNLYIQEVEDKMDARISSGGKSRDSSSLDSLHQRLIAERDKLEAEVPGAARASGVIYGDFR